MLQNATFRCFVNCMFRCPDIETETTRQGHFDAGGERAKVGGLPLRYFNIVLKVVIRNSILVAQHNVRHMQ